jgi:hypothetical protein
MKTGAGHGVFRSSVWLGTCKHDLAQPPSTSAPLQSMPAAASRRIPCGSRGSRWRHARGKSASDGAGAAAHLVHSSASEEASGVRPELGYRSELRTCGSGWPDRPSGWSRAEPLGDAEAALGAHHAARGRSGLRASSRGLRRTGAEAPERRGVSLAGNRRSG